MIEAGKYVRFEMDSHGLPQAIMLVDNEEDASHVVTDSSYGLGTAIISFAFEELNSDIIKKRDAILREAAGLVEAMGKFKLKKAEIIADKIIAWFIKEKFVLGGEIALLF